MQTKQKIQRLLASAGLQPNKRLSQNFLIDLNLMRLLIDSANISSSDTILEVGCGTGSLTEGLTEKAGKIIAVELDRALAKIAKRQLADKKNVEVINADILDSKHTISRTVTGAIEQSRSKHAGQFLLIANLPYNVASPVMLNLATGPTAADGMYVTVQKEVAQRMTAGPGSKHYGTLSIFLSAAGKVKTIRALRPTVFWPQPQVDSAMISFVREQKKAERIKDVELFSEVVNLFMQHRRKMLKACTKFAAGKLTEIHSWSEVFERCSIDPHNRSEQLQPEDFISISNLCYKYLKQTFL